MDHSPVTAQPPKKLVNKVDKVPTSLSKNIERKLGASDPPFNLEQAEKILSEKLFQAINFGGVF